MALFELYKNCILCPRQCGVNRHFAGRARSGFCRETDQLKVAHIGPHFGEEPSISGTRGSGTIFFSGCSLMCSYCQNHQISHEGMGKHMSLDQLIERVEEMIRVSHVHNINFVTPDHFFPHVFLLVSRLRIRGFDLPIVYNLSGYQSVDMLKIAENYVDVYLPDYKYADPSLAAQLSKCRDYPAVALDAIGEMVKQKGFLDACSMGPEMAGRGVLVRHLILPGHVENSMDVLTSLFVEFGGGVPLSLMSQYYPVFQHKDKDLNRFIYHQEFDRVYSHATELGFENLFVQFPEKESLSRPTRAPFLPDFRKTEPFR